MKEKAIRDATILVTGGTGSFGHRVATHLREFGPRQIRVYSRDEKKQWEMQRSYPDLHFIIGDVRDPERLHEAMRGVDFVFHAAAYKHVHLMEWNPLACFKNNVLGTAALASLAERYGVKQFVMISTDKAVNPRGIMGLSKRLAERVILERHPSGTLFNVVRFGNVLGSSGSVIPMFQRQIRDGGPVTVTSKEAKRFFMSIPEAVQLVLQASTLNESNAIFMLEMGEPVSIDDLARNLIELSGFRVGEDIEIVYTGLRPGEKLEEELLTHQENLEKTAFEKIRLQRNANYDPDKVAGFVHDLKSVVDIGNIKGLHDLVKEMIPEMIGPDFEEMRRNMFA